MHILVTNDDGIESPGLWLLAAALRDAGFGQVTVIAPHEEQSGTSMSLPPRLDHEIYPVEPEAAFAGITAYALTGTPVNCVTAAMLETVGSRPDVIVSGINRGLNSGTNVMLSGTVGAAMIGTLWGVPAMAVSAQWIRDQPMAWETAAWAATQVFPLLLDSAQATDRPTLLNVNVPNLPEREGVRGFRQTTLSDFFYGDFMGLSPMEPSERGGHRFRYGPTRSIFSLQFDEWTDDGAIRAGYVSVTPLNPISTHPNIDVAAMLAALQPDERDM